MGGAFWQARHSFEIAYYQAVFVYSTLIVSLPMICEYEMKVFVEGLYMCGGGVGAGVCVCMCV